MLYIISDCMLCVCIVSNMEIFQEISIVSMVFRLWTFYKWKFPWKFPEISTRKFPKWKFPFLSADAQSILSFFIGLRTILIDDLRIIRINIIILYRNGWRIYNIIYDIIYMIIMLWSYVNEWMNDIIHMNENELASVRILPSLPPSLPHPLPLRYLRK